MDNNFIVSARKYRPTTFSSVVGQKNLTATLRNAIATDRLAHSYLFCGSRGVGKTSCARIFAKTINCEHRTPQGDPCNECASCKAFNEGRSFNIIELDAASNNGVDDMRKLTEQVMVPPTDGRYRVFIIDEVHMLSTNAFNAFLKTLEEPPSYVIFILATTEKHKIIPTILSRCQIFDFNRITVNDIVDHLAHVAESEGVNAEHKALAVIANQADGAMRDALSIFDQIVASSRGNVTYQSTIENLSILDNSYFLRLMDAFAKSDVAEALLIFKEIRDKGFNTHFFINGLQSFIRDLMVARDTRTLDLLDATDEEKKQLVEVANRFSPEFYFMALSLINDADLKYRDATNKTFLTELLLIKLCQLLSPSPVFRGKEEGHIDSLLPLGNMKAAVANNTSEKSGDNKKTAPSPSSESNNINDEKSDAAIDIQKVTLTPQTGIKRKVKPIGINIISLNDGDKKNISDVSEIKTDSTAVFDEKSLDKAWNDIPSILHEHKIVVNTIKSINHEIISFDPPVIKLTFHNVPENIVDELTKILQPYLSSQLGINNIDIKVEVKDDGSTNMRMWSEREVLKNMLDHNPEMARFVHDLGLTLS